MFWTDDKSIEKLSNSICDKLLSVKDKKEVSMPKGKDFSLTGEQLVKELSNILGEYGLKIHGVLNKEGIII